MPEPLQGTLMIYLVISLCLCFFFFLFKLFHKLWWTPRRIQQLMALQGIKGPSYRFLYGNTKQMMRMRHEAMSTPMEISHHIFPRVAAYAYSCTKLYGMNYLSWIGSKPMLTVTDPDLVKVILNNRDGAYSKSDPLGHIGKILGDGLVTSEGEKWHKMRRLADHAFHGESLKDMNPAMIASVEVKLERWRNEHEGKEIDVYHEFKLLTSEMISRTAFGSSYLEGKNIFDMLTKMVQIVSRSAFKVRIPVISKFLKTSDEVESLELENGIRDSIIKLIKKREQKVMTGEEKSFGGDFLGSLLEAYHSEDVAKKISVDDMINECKTFYVAGHETVLSLLSWTVLLLAVHSNWQEKAREEVFEVLGQENPTSQGIARLTKMGMIINESLRLYSPNIFILRKVRRGVKLGDLIFPCNMEVNIPTPALHHNPEIWGNDGHLFKPERFAQGVAKATNNNTAAFIPFGLGPRICVGLNYATNQTKIALSMILRRYRFTLSPNYVHSPAPMITIRPQHGLQIILHPLYGTGLI